MKLSIDYDFYNAILNVNEPLHPLKFIRNDKKRYALLLPMDLSLFLIAMAIPNVKIEVRDIIASCLRVYGISISFDYIAHMLIKMISPSHIDLYAQVYSEHLKRLVSMLKDINVNTSYEMLLESELYAKSCNVEFNNNKLPYLKSEKYIYVPTYRFDGEESITSILQEHIIGTNEYTLSVGEPNKQERLVLVKSHI